MSLQSSILNNFPTPRFLKFSYVGFEIHPDSFRYTEFINKGKGFELCRFGEQVVPAAESVFTNEVLRNAIKSVVKKEGFEYVKVTLPEESTYLFTTTVDSENPEEIRNSIEFRLEENVPISGSNALFEYYLLPKKEGKAREAVVSVVSREVVDNYTEFLKSAGVTTVSFMVESSSISRAVIKKGDLETYLIAYLSRRKTVFAVVSEGFVQFSSTIATGGDALTLALKKYYEISDEEAESMKKNKGFVKGAENQDLFGALANAVSVIRDEIQRVAIYWGTHRSVEGKKDIKKIILCGRESVIPGLKEYLSSSLRRDVDIANVWANLPLYAEDVPEINFNDSVRFGACVGLSLN